MATSWADIAAKAKAPEAPAAIGEGPRIAVVDANALITGSGLLDLVRFADRCVTTPEVLREVRDKQSRAALEALPFTIETQEPAEDSVKAIVRFARATGDVHALSAADVRLLALTRSLEVAANGGRHLRELPPPPRQAKKRVVDAKALPGWGAEGGDWAEMDRLNEEELAAAEAALLAGGGAESRIASAVQALSLNDAAEQQGGGETAADSSAAGAEEEEEADEEEVSGSEGEGEEEEEDGEWETAARTHNVLRRQRRRAIRKAQREAAAEAEAAQEEEEEEEEGSSSGSEGEEESDGEEEEEEEEASTSSGFESSISIITADFAMQNVALQMGLRLVTPDGRRINRLSKWVLRCSACFQITKEMGRIFCPRCGNAALEKVRVTIGPDGAEQYGVRRKHILRGTKFSIPKPRGGRRGDAILREDQLLAKAHRLRKKKDKAAELDPFAPEYGQTDAWFQAAAFSNASKGAAVLLAGWKHNPNERKRGERRRK